MASAFAYFDRTESRQPSVSARPRITGRKKTLAETGRTQPQLPLAVFERWKRKNIALFKMIVAAAARPLRVQTRLRDSNPSPGLRALPSCSAFGGNTDPFFPRHPFQFGKELPHHSFTTLSRDFGLCSRCHAGKLVPCAAPQDAKGPDQFRPATSSTSGEITGAQ